MNQVLANIGAPAPTPAVSTPRRKPNLTKRQKAAVIVRLLLKEGAPLSLDELPETLQIELTHEMGALRRIDKDTLDEIVGDFVSEVNDLGMSFAGGLEGALETLDGAISSSSIRRIRQETGLIVSGDPWKMIAGLADQKIIEIVLSESVEVAAVVISKLPVTRSAEILGRLPGNLAREITYAVSTTSAIDPETVRTIGIGVAGQVMDETPKAFHEEPVDRVGAILNSSPAATRDDVLDGLEQEDAVFAHKVRKAIFTFGDIADRIDVKDIPKVARAVDQGLLVTALVSSGASAEASVNHILENMSKRLSEAIREEMEEVGQVKTKDGEEAQNAVVAAIKDMEQAGELVLIDPDAED